MNMNTVIPTCTSMTTPTATDAPSTPIPMNICMIIPTGLCTPTPEAGKPMTMPTAWCMSTSIPATKPNLMIISMNECRVMILLDCAISALKHVKGAWV